MAAYWAGNPRSEADVQAIRKMSEFKEDFFETDFEELKETMEQFDEYERDQAARI